MNSEEDVIKITIPKSLVDPGVVIVIRATSDDDDDDSYQESDTGFKIKQEVKDVERDQLSATTVALPFPACDPEDDGSGIGYGIEEGTKTDTGQEDVGGETREVEDVLVDERHPQLKETEKIKEMLDGLQAKNFLIMNQFSQDQVQKLIELLPSLDVSVLLEHGFPKNISTSKKVTAIHEQTFKNMLTNPKDDPKKGIQRSLLNAECLLNRKELQAAEFWLTDVVPVFIRTLYLTGAYGEFVGKSQKQHTKLLDILHYVQDRIQGESDAE